MSQEAETLQLWKACYCGDVKLLQRLINRHGVDAEQRDRNGESILHMAARSGRVEVIKLLLRLNIDPNAANNNMQTPLHLAASKGYSNVVQALIEGGCDLNRKTKFTEMTALHVASQKNQTDVVKALLEGGALCQVPDTIGRPPVFYTQNPEIVHLFAKHTKHFSQNGTASQTNLPNLISPEQVDSVANDSIASIKDDDNDSNTKSVAHPEQVPARSLSSRRKKSKSPSGKNWARLLKMAGKKRKGKKVKVNHSLSFSNQHKLRMELNVFDRLVGGSKKKKSVLTKPMERCAQKS